jgi:hypothetical protein
MCDTLLTPLNREKELPLWRHYFDRLDFTIRGAAQLLALNVSALLGNGNYSPPRCSLRDLGRYLLLLRYFSSDGYLHRREASLRQHGDDPTLSTLVPQGALQLVPACMATAAQLQLRQNHEMSTLFKKLFFLLSEKHFVLQETFQGFLRTVLLTVAGGAFLPREADVDESCFRVAGGVHVVDAVVNFEWRAMRAGAQRRVSFKETVKFIGELILTLLLCGPAYADPIVGNSIEVTKVVLLPVALRCTSRKLRLLHIADTGTSNDDQAHAERDVVERFILAEDLSNERKVAGKSAMASDHPRHLIGVPSQGFDGTAQGITDSETVGPLQLLLAATSRPEITDFESRMRHRRLVNIMDAYPIKIHRPQ